jgi:Flp pilus assembly pilin Flp
MRRTAPRRRARAQAVVEYGLLVAAGAIMAIIGLVILRDAVAGYLGGQSTNAQPSANVIAGLPLHAVDVRGSCTPLPPPVYTGQSFGCSLTVTDLYRDGPPQVPAGTLDFVNTTGTFSPNPCSLTASPGSSTTSSCAVVFTPTTAGPQVLQATYNPTSNHLSQTWQNPTQIVAVDQTRLQLSCASGVPLGEPASCTASVLDLFTNGLVPGASITWTTTGGASGTFSPPGALSPQQSTDQCTTPSPAGPCGRLFRSGISAQDQGVHTVLADYPGDAYHDKSNNTASVTVNGPRQHVTNVQVVCAGGTSRQQPVPLLQQVQCGVTVEDKNPLDSNGNPTNISPTGSVDWSVQPNNGAAGGFSPSSCQLSRLTDAAAQCTTFYQPTALAQPDGLDGDNTHPVVASYSSSDPVHPSTDGTTTVYVHP